MRMLELQSKDFVCEVCGESAANPTDGGSRVGQRHHVADSTLSSLRSHRHRLDATLPRNHDRLHR